VTTATPEEYVAGIACGLDKLGGLIRKLNFRVD
jgi:hypothetical protein